MFDIPKETCEKQLKMEATSRISPLTIYNDQQEPIVVVKYDGGIEVNGREIETDQEYRDTVLAICTKLAGMNYKDGKEKARLEEIFQDLMKK